MRGRLSQTALLVVLCGGTLVLADHSLAAEAPMKVVKRLPGPDGGWDYASVDGSRRRVYVAHGQKVMTIDADTGKTNPDFAAGDHLHAVVPIPGTNLILTTNSGDNSARLVSADDGGLVASVPTPADPDGAIYDPSTGDVVVVGGDSSQVTLIDPKAAKAVASFPVEGGLEFPAVDGKGKLYVNVEGRNEVAAVDIASRRTLARFAMPGCQRPTGLAYVSGDRLVVACGNGVAKILQASDGREIASFKIGVFPDAVIYDAARDRAYIPSAMSGDMAVIALAGVANNTVVETVPTALGARTGAVDPKTGEVYLPTAQYVLPAPAGQRPSPRPGTFEVLVVGR